MHTQISSMGEINKHKQNRTKGPNLTTHVPGTALDVGSHQRTRETNFCAYAPLTLAEGNKQRGQVCSFAGGDKSSGENWEGKGNCICREGVGELHLQRGEGPRGRSPCHGTQCSRHTSAPFSPLHTALSSFSHPAVSPQEGLRDHLYQNCGVGSRNQAVGSADSSD